LAHLNNADDYRVKKASMCNAARAVARAALDQETLVELNAANVPPGSLYLTVTGTLAEARMMARPAAAIGPMA
jgi:S-adenosylmethionine synthetase